MKKNNLFVLFLVFSVAVGTGFAQYGKNSPLSWLDQCGLTGTWYGSSEGSPPYQVTFEPLGVGRYSARYQWAVDPAMLGVTGTTDWTGVFIKGQGQRYDGYIIAYFVGAPEGLDMKFVHEVIEFQDCNTFTSTIDLFGGFIPWTEEKIPFVTQPDYNMFDILGVNTIVETYHRMPTSCPICPAQ